MRLGESVEEANQRLFDCPHPVVLVTGSTADRVGRRIAEHFSAAGFRVVLHSHSADAGTDSNVLAGDTVDLVVTGGVNDETQVTSWQEQISAKLGRCDVVVNSAAIWDPIPLEEITAADFERYLSVNAVGTALVAKVFGLAMTKQASGGAIINLGDWSIARPYTGYAAYFPSKGAVKAITESMAVELATRNPRVRVNAILPGPVKLAEGISAQQRQAIADECLLQREGSADDVAQAAMFLATSPFVTGVSIPVDGGRTIYAGPSKDACAHPGA